MKYVILFLSLIVLVYVMAYHNALAVGITHEQAVAFWQRQLICVLGGAVLFYSIGVAYVLTSSRKKK